MKSHLEKNKTNLRIFSSWTFPEINQASRRWKREQKLTHEFVWLTRESYYIYLTRTKTIMITKKSQVQPHPQNNGPVHTQVRKKRRSWVSFYSHISSYLCLKGPLLGARTFEATLNKLLVQKLKTLAGSLSLEQSWST